MPISETLAISAAVCIALSGMLINELRGQVPLLRLARWQMLAAFSMTGAAAFIMGGWRTIEPWQFGALALSSLFGIILASTTYFSAIYSAGARVTALLFSLTAPFALLLGYVVLGETISMRQGAGVVLVLAGIVLAIGIGSRQAPSRGVHSSSIVPVALPLAGITLGVVTALGQATGSLFARPAMAAGVEPFAAMAVRSGIAAIFFVIVTMLPIAALRQTYRFQPRHLGIAATASFFGTGLGMSLLMAALASGNVGIVSTLSSMTPVVILPMVWLRTGIAPPAMAWIGAAIAVAGTALISI